MTTQKEALKLAIDRLEWFVDAYPHDITVNKEEFLRPFKEALAQPEQDKERCVGCEACIDTACGRDECPKGWPKAAQPEQEPVAIYQYQMGNGSWIDQDQGSYRYNKQHGHTVRIVYTTPPQRKPLTFDEVEACFPDGGGTNEHGEAVVSAQWLHDFAAAVQRAAHGIKGDA